MSDVLQQGRVVCFFLAADTVKAMVCCGSLGAGTIIEAGTINRAGQGGDLGVWF